MNHGIVCYFHLTGYRYMISEVISTKISKLIFSHPYSKFLATVKVGLAHYYPFRGGGSHFGLSGAVLFQVVPSLALSSCRLLLGCPPDLFPLLDCSSVQRIVHLLSFSPALCPAHFHFCFSMSSMMSDTFVLFLISEHATFLFSFEFNIFLSIALITLI